MYDMIYNIIYFFIFIGGRMNFKLILFDLIRCYNDIKKFECTKSLYKN